MIEKQRIPVLQSYLIYQLPQSISFPMALYPDSCRHMFFNISRVVTLYPTQKIEDFLQNNEYVAFICTFYNDTLSEKMQNIIMYIDNDSAFRKYHLAGELVSTCIWSGLKAVRDLYTKCKEDRRLDFFVPFSEQENGHKSLLSVIDEMYETFDERDVKTFTEGFILYGVNVAMDIPSIHIAIIN